MEQNPSRPFQELHSEEIHDIISQPPHWLLQWSVSVIMGLMILAGFASWWIRFPDVITTSFVLISGDAPGKVIVRKTGHIQKILVKDGSEVQAGQVLLYCDSEAIHEQVLRLDIEMKRLDQAINSGDWQTLNTFSSEVYTNLGEIQSVFQTFCNQLKAVPDEEYLIHKRQRLLNEVSDLKALRLALIEEQGLRREEYELAISEFKIKQKLFKENAILSLEYNKEKAKILSDEIAVKNIITALTRNQIELASKQQQLLELDNANIRQKNDALQAFQALKSDIKTWKRTYVLYAPASGILSFAENLQEQQTISSNELLMTINSENQGYRGLIKVPQKNLGKIHVGQKVLVKLDGYPYREYGIMEGKLAHVSAIAEKDGVYLGYVNLPNDRMTLYRKQIVCRKGMVGTAEIITADRRLADRLITSVRNGRE